MVVFSPDDFIMSNDILDTCVSLKPKGPRARSSPARAKRLTDARSLFPHRLGTGEGVLGGSPGHGCLFLRREAALGGRAGWMQRLQAAQLVRSPLP